LQTVCPYPAALAAVSKPSVGGKKEMVATSTEFRLEETARDLLEVVTQLSLTALRGKRRSGDLKEVEFLTLAILAQHRTMIVGDIQRMLGVLPAQMSRIIRSLENRDRPLIACHINPRDKRKVDVVMTAGGEKALMDYQVARTTRLIQVLRDLHEEDQMTLARLVEKLQALLERGAHA
jgi:DNA-binding MarR family transcriptional regulator